MNQDYTPLNQRLNGKGHVVKSVAHTLRAMSKIVSGLPARQDRDDAGLNDVVDLTNLVEFQSLIETAEEALRDCARRLHDSGHSWTEIGRALGISRQAALKRFGPTSRD